MIRRLTQWFAASGNRSRRRFRAQRSSVMLTPATICDVLEDRTLLLHPLTAVPVLNSLAGAPVTLYLDFNGHTESDASWIGTGSPIVTPAFDNDNDATTFSDEELRRIEEIWYRVSEDYAPLNINVSTVEPAAIRDFESVRVVLGGNGAWNGEPSGGVSLVNSFSSNQSNTCFVFTDNLVDETGKGAPNFSAMNASHEAGHTFGLVHHSQYNSSGQKTREYDPGDLRLGPIMGAAFYSERSTWNNGPSNISATTMQDDLVVLTRAGNQTVQFRIDDIGSTTSAATTISALATVSSVFGLIERNDDVDFFRFETTGGLLSISAEGLNLRRIYGNQDLNFGTNLDVVLKLYNAGGTLLRSANPADSIFATMTEPLTSGTYYIAVSGTGEYGALGQYTLTTQVTPAPPAPVMSNPTGTITSPRPVFEWTSVSGVDHYELVVANQTTGQTTYYQAASPTASHTAFSDFLQGNYQARVRAVTNMGQTSEWSSPTSFSLDIPTPSRPSVTKPSGTVATLRPTFEWSASTNAASYTIWVNNLATGQRVSYTTGVTGTTWTPGSDLAEGRYRVWVQAVNSAAEASAWSPAVDFRIEIPAPSTPTVTSPSAVIHTAVARIEWTASAGAAGYDLWVRNLTTGEAQYIRETSLPSDRTWFETPSLPQGTYRVWVRASGATGKFSAWSPARDFIVDILPPSAPTVTGPVGTGNSNVVTTLSPIFQWTAADRAVRYDLWVSNFTTGQGQIIRQSNLETLSYTASLLPQGQYKAWVRGINSANEAGVWSSAYSFVIDEPVPGTTQLTSPVVPTSGIINTAMPRLAWGAVAGAATYQLRIDNLTTSTAQVVLVTGLTSAEYTLTRDQRLGENRYSAMVRAVNQSGEFGAWSTALQFRVDVPTPVTPSLLAPTGTSSDRTPLFRWTHQTAGYRYEIFIRDLGRNVSTTLSADTFQISSDGTEASVSLPDASALPAGNFRCWIRAFNATGESSLWSTAVDFVLT